ncbi:DM13 domain-containing protein [Shewanella psychropiezotolerans]|uniref:DM13 domain-containing protein n=1 Tax=Shewanella psychropiezotolerans TaxID=2593655 RepID=A0ABX5X3G6_9GAMM|nr:MULTISPECIES: DM13 domain-containing protein [Shewanella]MPY21068.1 DM13 domain-containing protein [Shewanella sp. YLB-07]MPY21855.1 DM13 domain-containing protein [Shewanella sp. YLB-07]QDO85262.1 DM13 domain-containing protein [Shewanella psychropiezotolerans]
MKKRLVLSFALSHVLAVFGGFVLGIYYLPILIAPAAPDSQVLALAAENRLFVAEFSRDREDSDALHWGEGEVSIGPDSVSFSGSLSPGPDYKLYLSPEFVETEADFNRLKSSMVQVGEVKTFENFILPMSVSIDPSQYNTVIVWCETFGQYITSAKYERRVN